MKKTKPNKRGKIIRTKYHFLLSQNRLVDFFKLALRISERFVGGWWGGGMTKRLHGHAVYSALTVLL